MSDDWIFRYWKHKGYNPDQPRDPEGTSTGGQWTSSEGEIDALYSEVSGWGGARAKVAQDALDFPGHKVVTFRDGDELVGVASVSAVNEGPGADILGKGYEEISSLATKRGGYGKKMMAQIAEDAYQRGHGISLYSAPDAIGFYRKLGMARSRKAQGYFFLGKDAIPQFIRRWREGEKAMDDEPGDGVFVKKDEQTQD